MSPHALFCELLAAGITLTLSPDGENLAAPAGRLTAEQRAVVLENKAALVAFLVASRKTTAALVRASMRACDHHRDGADARERMRQECLSSSPDLQADLLNHFNQTYPENK